MRYKGIFSVVAVLLFASMGHAQTWTYRAAVASDAAVLATLHNEAVAGGLLYTDKSTWTSETATTFLGLWDATQVVLQTGTVVGFWGSFNWTLPNREARTAITNVPYISTGLNASDKATAYKYLARAIDNHLRSSVSTNGTTPTWLTMEWPKNNTAESALTAMGCVVLSSATDAGVPVLDELACNLATLNTALIGAGVP